MNYRLISKQAELDSLLPEIENASEIALDTEADNMYHYHNRVCLLQIRWGKTIVLVDTLADGIDLDPLFAILGNQPLVMHGSDFDLRPLSGSRGVAADSLFDTMLAAQSRGRGRIGRGSVGEQ